ncbi:hypothetical protein BGW39_001957 [Mortierella sp. 14UC]|nr:hypothetical protein BGW39_001957 [Mortierella sp. 14UC]
MISILRQPASNRPPKPKSLKKQLVQTKIIQPLLDSSTPPELPLEILEFVCIHLSKATLRYSVNRVCRKWHEASNRFIRRVGSWKPVDGVKESLLEQWSKFNTLELWFNQDPEFPALYISSTKNFSSWCAFAAAITKCIPTSQEVQQDSIDSITVNDDDGGNSTSVSVDSLCLLHSIRHMELRGTNMPYNDFTLKLRGHLQFIESLAITTSLYYAITPLFTILADFPSLKRLTLTLNLSMRPRLTHGDSDDLIVDVREPPVDPATAHFPRKPWIILPPKLFPDRYRLQEFSVSGVITHLRVLERLLVTCPDLRVFKAFNNEVDMSIREQGPSAEHNARQRLIDLAAEHCLKLEWYNFHRLEYSATDGTHLEYIAGTFPGHKILSMNFSGYQETMPSTLPARDLLSRITVLDIQTNSYISLDPTTMNRVLCLTPSLLHLFASKANFFTNCLWQPPAPVQPAPKPVFHTVRDRKRYERNERRKARQQALARFQPSALTNITDDGQGEENDTTASNFSTPDTWQLYNLKTLEMNLNPEGGFVAFTSYISQHRLFRNLVVSNLRIMALKVGQRETFTDPKKPSSYSSNTAAPNVSTVSNSSNGGKQHIAVVAPLSEPARFPNELLALRALQCLEECTFCTPNVPGMLLANDFDFMRRKKDFQTMSFLPKRPKSFAIPVATTTTVDPAFTQQPSSARRKMTKNRSSSFSSNINGKDGSDDGDDNDSADNVDDDSDDEEKERLETETFWPKLNTFQVYYIRMSPFLSVSKLVTGLEEIRPGVAFSFKHRGTV